MAGRWFIPIALVGFMILITGLWMYLGSQEDQFRQEFAELGISSTYPTSSAGPVAAGSNGRVEPIGLPPIDHLHRVDSTGPNAPSHALVRQDRFAVAPRRRQPQAVTISLSALAQRLAPKLDEAAVDVRSAIVHSLTGWYLRGVSAADYGDYAQAVTCFDQFLHRLPNNAVVLAAKASALIEMREHADAATILGEVVKIDPEFVSARYNYGVVLTRLALYGEATRQFREVVHRDPAHFRAQYNLASLTQRAGQLSEARDAWQAVTRLRPDIVGGWFNLGVISVDFGDQWEALRCFLEVTILDPEDPHGHANVALVYESLGQLDAALDAMGEADRLMPCDPVIMQHLADLHRGIAELGGRYAARHMRHAARLEQTIEIMEEDHLMGSHPILAGGDEAEG